MLNRKTKVHECDATKMPKRYGRDQKNKKLKLKETG